MSKSNNSAPELPDNYAFNRVSEQSNGPCYMASWADVVQQSPQDRLKDAKANPVHANPKQKAFKSAAVKKANKDSESVNKINGTNLDNKAEVACLSSEHDTLVLHFNLSLNGITSNDQNFKVGDRLVRESVVEKLRNLIKDDSASSNPQLRELSNMYAHNLLTGEMINYHSRNLHNGKARLVDVQYRSFLDGNNTSATLTVQFDEGVLGNDHDETVKKFTKDQSTAINKLGEVIFNHLKSENFNDSVTFYVTIYLEMETGREVRVTQQHLTGDSKKYYRITGSSKNHVGMSADAIGHCFRVVDKWYDGYDGVVVPLESSGQNEKNGIVRKNPRRTDNRPQDFKAIFDNFHNADQIHEGDIAYMLGMLVRGCVTTSEAK